MQGEHVLVTTALSATAPLVPLRHLYAQPARLDTYLAKPILALLITMLIVLIVQSVVAVTAIFQISDR